MLDTDTSNNPAPVAERSYKAFISYRHKPLDREAAEMIQKHLERYRVPKEFRETVGGDRLGIVFRDEDELPASSSLSDSITYALDHSEYLIVICTPDLPDSRWCEQEIRYFTEKKGQNKIIAVLADGEPGESFSPYMLHEFDENGDIISDREPLAANIKGPNHTIDKKSFKKEIVRLYAALIGCPFDSLWQREKRRQNSRLIGILSGVMLLLSLFLGIVISNNIRISEKNKEIQKQMSSMYIDAGFESLQEFDIKGAAKNALLSYESDSKDIYDHRIEALLSQVLNAYKKDNVRPEILYEQSVGIADILPVDSKKIVYISDEAGYVRCIDVNTGNAKWTSLTNRQLQKEGPTRLFLSSTGDIICRDNDAITLLAADDGSQIWRYDYQMPIGTTFRAISPDGKFFALIDRIDGKYHLLILDTLTGEIHSETEIPYFAYSTGTDNDWYYFGSAFSADSRILGLAYYTVPDTEDDYEFGYLFMTIDTDTCEVLHKYILEDYESSRDIFFGLNVENRTGNLFYAQYHNSYGGIMTSHIDWSNESHKREFTNFTLSQTSYWYTAHYPEAVFSDDLAVVFCERTILIFNIHDGTFLKSYEYTGDIINGFWVDKGEEVVQFFTSSGTVVSCDLEHGEYVLNRMNEQPLNHDNVILAASINGGLFNDQGYGKGTYLSVSGDHKERLLVITVSSDDTVVEIDPKIEDYYTVSVSEIPGSSDLMLFIRQTESDTILIVNSISGKIKERYPVGGKLYSECYPLDEKTFICENIIYHLGKDPEYLEGLNEDTWSSFYFRDCINLRLPTGEVMSLSLSHYRNGGYYRRFWINGKVPASGGFIRYPAKIETSSYGSLFKAGTNGSFVEAVSSASGNRILLYFDPLNDCFSTFDSPYADDDKIILSIGNESGVFASFGDAGLYLYSTDPKSKKKIETPYSAFEIIDMCFSTDDRYLIVLTKSGKIECLDDSSGDVMMSEPTDLPTLHLEYVESMNVFSGDTDDFFCLLIKNSLSGYSKWYKIDSSSWIVVQQADNAACLHKQQNHLIIVSNGSILIYPVHTLTDLVGSARIYIQE